MGSVQWTEAEIEMLINDNTQIVFNVVLGYGFTIYNFKSSDFLLSIPSIWITEENVFLNWSMFFDRH
jgi:hypothetical protein